MNRKSTESILQSAGSDKAAVGQSRASKEKAAIIEWKSSFMDNMAYQIRTLSNAVIGFSDLLLQEELDGIQSEYAREIFNSGQSLASLVNDMLDISKIESGQLEMGSTSCSMSWLLDEVDLMIRPLSSNKGLEFRIFRATDLPANIRSDPARLRQCLVNLAGNAVKFTRQGRVHLEVSVDTYQDNSYIRFDIIDSGIGVAEERLDTIFYHHGEFDRASESILSSLDQGLAIHSGLAVVNQLAILLGGGLGVVSEEGIGSVFTLVTPAGLDIALEASSLDRGIHPQPGTVDQDNLAGKFAGRVLLVDDNRTNQTVVSLLLQAMGFEITVACDGLEAIEKAGEGEFDLVLMDVKMPNMDGCEATKLLRQNGLVVPVIGISAANEPQEYVFDDFIVKPVDSDGLFRVISKHLPVSKFPVGQMAESKSK